MGQDVTRVMELDVLQFNALVGTMTRLHYREKEEAAWTALVTSQGTEKDLIRLTNGWRKAIGADPMKGQKEMGPKDFIRDARDGKIGGGAKGLIRQMTNAGMLKG